MSEKLYLGVSRINITPEVDAVFTATRPTFFPNRYTMILRL